MKAYFTITLAASVVLMSSNTIYAATTEDQTLEPVTLAAAEGNSDGSSQLSPIAPTPQILPITPTQTAAGPQLTVNTTKIGIPLERVGSFATIVTKQQIQQMQVTSLVDVLRRVPGVDVVQNGGLGQPVSIFIRGMNAEHTLVLIDGIEVNDPISPGRTFNFPDQVSLDSVDRIEVLRGPQSQLYGSDAIGGVINIITEVGSGKPAMYVKTQGGSYHTVQGDADLRGGLANDKLRFTLHAMKQSTAGFSSASSRYGNQDRNGFNGTSLSSRVAIQPFRNVSLNFMSMFANSRTGVDNFGGFGGDDPNYHLHNKSLLLGGRSRITFLDGKFEQIARFSVSNQWRRSINNPDAANPFDSEHSQYNSQMLKVDVQNNYHLNKMNTLTGGAEIGNERGDLSLNFQSQFGPFTSAVGNHTSSNVGLYFQDYIKLSDRWFTTVGARWDEYNRFGHATTYRAATSYVIPETGTTFRASYGTGFKAPTLYQLYAPGIGNTNLNAEKSQGWDTGIEQNLFKNKFKIGATFYHNHLNNWINTTPVTQFTSRYNNVGNAEMHGSEVYSTWTPYRWLTARGSYTATFTKNLDTHEQLLRRPHHKSSFNINFQPGEKFNLNFDITHIGNRTDLDFSSYPAPRVQLNSYTLISMAMSYKLAKNCTIFGRLVNLLDTPYEDVKGYGSPRISAYGGLQLGI